MTTKTTKPKSETQLERSKLIKLIHVAKRELRLDDGMYRDTLQNTVGKTSSKDCTTPELRKVLKELKDKGFTVTFKNVERQNKPRVIPALQGTLDKIEALLTDAKLPWSYADGIAKNMFDKSDLTLCNGDELRRIMLALQYNSNRKQASIG